MWTDTTLKVRRKKFFAKRKKEKGKFWFSNMCKTRGRSLESPAGHCEDGPHQGGIQERTEAQQTEKQADNHIRELKPRK